MNHLLTHLKSMNSKESQQINKLIIVDKNNVS